MRRAKPPTQPTSWATQKPPYRNPHTRIHGVHACLTAFAKRPGDLRRVYLCRTRLDAFKPVLAFCAKRRIAYRIVDGEELERITASTHHEGVCFEMTHKENVSISSWLSAQRGARAPSLLLWLDGVDNPHNYGAILRTAAHFGADGVLLPEASTLHRSGAAARVARGGAEAMPTLRISTADEALTTLRQAGYSIASTVPRGGKSVYASPLPPRLVLVFGAEDDGIREGLLRESDLRLRIPGSGEVESLNVGASVAVVLGEYWRQRGERASARNA